METIGVGELKECACEIVRRVRDDGEAFEVSYRGLVFARLVPVTQPETKNDLSSFSASWEELAKAIGSHWPDGVSAVDAVREGRREL